MARGRMINNKISLNRKFNCDLKSDTSRMFFIMTISHLDVEGRIIGDPMVMKSHILPWREDITKEDIQEYIIEWVQCGFVKWYEVDETKYLWFPSFSNNQTNLRKEREAPSSIPSYSAEHEIDIAELLRSNAGVTPDQLPPKINEVNISLTRINPSATQKSEKSANKDSKASCDSKESLPCENSDEKSKKQENWQFIEKLFQEKQDYDNWGKQRKHCKELDKRIRKVYQERAPDMSLQEFTKKTIQFFWYLANNGNSFWKKQKTCFFPSTLNSERIWTMFLGEIKKRKKPTTAELMKGLENLDNVKGIEDS